LAWNHWFIIWMKCLVLYHCMWALFRRDCSYNCSLNLGLMGLIFGSSAKRQFPLETFGFSLVLFKRSWDSISTPRGNLSLKLVAHCLCRKWGECW
jgi:hypothetical protein